MKKYLAVLAVTIKEYFVYRLNFILWRFRVVLNILLPLFLWTAVLDRSGSIASYDRSQFVSYLIYGNLIGTFVFGTRTFEISSDINDGKIINTLLKPVSFFNYHFAREIADKLMNVFFAFIEMYIIVSAFKLEIISPQNLILFILIFINALFISYFINLTLSFLGFWTTEIWPIRFIYIMLLSFVAGNYFPLDIMPKALYNFIMLTPFPYMFYLPAKVLISGSSLNQGINGTIGQLLFMSYLWLFGSYFFAKVTWTKGIKSFSFWGR